MTDTAMTDTLDLLSALPVIWMTGSTLVLGIACLSLLIFRQPVWRQRIAEIGVGCCLFWMVLSALPMPQVVTHTMWPMHNLKTLRGDVQRLGLHSTSHQTHLAKRPAGDSHVDVDSNSIPALIINDVPNISTQGLIHIVPGAGAQEAGFQMRRHLPAVLYGAGFVLGWIWLGLARVGLWKMARPRMATPEWIVSLHDSLPGRRPSQLIISSGTRRPFSYGLRTPVILLPDSICMPDKKGALRHVLLHEQAHVDRCDAWGNLLLNLALPFLYVHPLYWLLRRELIFCRELLADDWAARHTSRITYAQDLLQLVRDVPQSWSVAIGALGAFRFRHSFTRRMKMLLDRDRPLLARLSRPRFVFLAVTSLSLTVGLGLIVRLPADEPRSDAESHGQRPPAQTDRPKELGIDTTVGQSSSFSAPTAGDQQTAGNSVEAVSPYRQDRATAVRSPDSSFSGCVLMAHTDITLGAPIDGQIADLMIEDGATVKNGDALCQFDDGQLRAELEIARAKADVSINAAKDDLDVKLHITQVEVVKSELETAIAANQKVPGTISPSEISRHRRRQEAAEISVEQARRDQRNAKLAAEIARAEYMEVVRRHSQRRIVAPVEGVVVELFCSRGDTLKLGAPICRIVSFDHVTVHGYADAERYNPADLQGQPVTVEIQRARGEIVRKPARIDFASPVVDTAGKFLFKVKLQNEQHNGHWLLRPGMLAVVRLTQSTPQPVDATIGIDIEGTPRHDMAEHVSPEEIEFLQELVDAHQDTHKLIQQFFQQGLRTIEDESSARYALCVSRMRLALATGKRNEAIEQMKSAVEAAETWVAAIQAAHEAGKGSLEGLLSARSKRAEAKLMLSRLQKRGKGTGF